MGQYGQREFLPFEEFQIREPELEKKSQNISQLQLSRDLKPY